MEIPTVVGMLGPSVTALQNMFKALLSARPWLHDPELLPIPYRSDAEVCCLERGGLTFGIFASDGIVTPHPPIRRAMRVVRSALEEAGHQVSICHDKLDGRPYPIRRLDSQMGATFPC